mgnify:FL=1
MDHLFSTKQIFFERGGLDPSRLDAVISEALLGADDGELYLEYCQSEAITLDDGKIKNAHYDTMQGFGLRAVLGEATAYAHSPELSLNAIQRAAKTISAVKSGHGGKLALPPTATAKPLYPDLNPMTEMDFDSKVALLLDIDEYLRSIDDRVVQVMASISGEWQAIRIIRPNGSHTADIRPLVQLNISVTVADNGRMENGSRGTGGRSGYSAFIEPNAWQNQANEALRQALINLESVPTPAGEMVVVLGPGWPGILLHEAIGHGLEGDFNRKKTSAFSGLLGERVASPGVVVVDDGTIANRRGSITIDDEGTTPDETVLIEDGILTGYIQDRMNARLMGMQTTGNGRRQSYAHLPMPRMTNTYMKNGDKDPSEILQSVEKGIYAVNFGGGQVDITSGKFVFSCTEAYLIENGKLGPPVKGATLIGNGPDVLTRIAMVGNDIQLDPGIGSCGKNGQSVPVGVGQPTLRLNGLTVGGTAA